MLCPVLVGRSDALSRLSTRIDDAAQGRGGVVVLVGDAGIGKSRLVADATRHAISHGLTVLTGRAVPSESPTPYRPLSEAFANALRGVAMPRDSDSRNLAVHLGRLVPAWSDGSAPAGIESAVVLGEAALRLLRIASGSAGGALLVLEDLHWADAETLDVLDYLAAALRNEPVLCLCTSRSGGVAEERIERLRRDDPSAVVEISRLTGDDVDRVVAECLQVALPPDGLDVFVRAHSDGVPFLVEELLAGLVASGDLRREGPRWVVGELHARVPASLRDSLRQRLAGLDVATRRVLAAAAVLGRYFEWELLPGVADVDGSFAIDALRRAIAAQVVESSGRGFRFRHALTREAVLDDLLPPERHDLARRAWPAVERAHPGLPGPTCELAAELAELAGENAIAADRLVLTGRRALAAGALATAQATARRAVRLAGDDHSTAVLAERLLLDVLVAAGNPIDALAIGQALASRVDTEQVEPAELAKVHLAIARAALAAGDLDVAAHEVSAAQACAASTADPRLIAETDVVSARVALDRDELGTAEELAQRALGSAAAKAEPVIESEALIVLGRIVRSRDWGAADQLFHRAADVAREANLPTLHLQAELEKSIQAWLDNAIPRLRETRDLALRYGAISTAAVIDLSLADIALLEFDTASCLAAAQDCVAASRRYRLATEPVAYLWLAGAHALTGDEAAMQEAIDAALASAPDDPRILGDLYGRVLVAQAVVADRLEALPALFAQMVEQVRRAPDAPTLYGGRALHALVSAAAGGPDAAAALKEAQRVAAGVPMFDSVAVMARALLTGPATDPAVAAEYGQEREGLLASSLGPALAHTTTLFVAPVAHRDGWGDPAGWLRAAEAFFADLGHERVARRCRLLLGEIGAPMPRRGRGDSDVPAGLRALGVTSREVDVLKLVAAGRTNRAIAEELMLSPKTVERHLSSLFVRAGVANRRDLAAVAAAHLRPGD